MGFQVVLEGDDCDSILTISLTGYALSRAYQDAPQACYSGAEVSGEVGLTTQEGETTIYPIGAIRQPPAGTVGCKTPCEAPFDRVWPRAVLEGLVHFWGADVLSAALEEVEWWERQTWSTPLRDAAAELLGESQPSESNVQILLDVLKTGSQFDREAAAAALGDLGPAEGVVPALIDTLADEERGVRRAAALALGVIGAEPQVVPALTTALDDEDHWVRLAVMESLAAIGPGAAEAVPELINLLINGNEFEREAAAGALGAIGPLAENAVPELIKALEDEFIWVGINAADALTAITNQTFSRDVNLWEQWWEEQK
jgi:HEAT repeat protein